MKILKTLLRKKTKVIDGKVWKLMSPEELNAVIFAKDREPDGRVAASSSVEVTGSTGWNQT